MIPAWIATTVRYVIAMLGVWLVAEDLVPQAMWDQIAAGFTTALMGAIEAWRARSLEAERDNAVQVAFNLASSRFGRSEA